MAGPSDEKSGWHGDKPQTEADAEKMQAESDRLVDRIQARLDREGPGADPERILEEEIERRRRERGEKPLTPSEEFERQEWIDEMNRVAEEAASQPGREPTGEDEPKHPLAEAAHELSLRLLREPKERGWICETESAEHPVTDLINSTLCARVKLHGALDGDPWPPDAGACAGVLVRLKRAHGFIDDARRAAEACEEERLVDLAWLAEIRRDLNSIAHECTQLIAELRAILARSCD